MKPLTNRALKYDGEYVSVTARLPKPVVDYIDENFKNRSEFIQHWAQVGKSVGEDPELDEALQWALEQQKLGPIKTVWEDGDVAIGVQAEMPSPEEMIERMPMHPEDELSAMREAQVEEMRNRIH